MEIVREGVPARTTRRLGEAIARCRGAMASDDAACTRQLTDQACELGGTVMWDLRSQEDADEGVRVLRGVVGVYPEP
jgi:hypothetical protein